MHIDMSGRIKATALFESRVVYEQQTEKQQQHPQQQKCISRHHCWLGS